MREEIKTNKVTVRMRIQKDGIEITPIIALIDADYILIEEANDLKMVHVYQKELCVNYAHCVMSLFKEDDLIITYKNEEGDDIEVYGEE